MQYKKIIYISYQPLTTAFEENFYISDFLSKGINVEYWDLTRIYHADLKLNYTVEKPYINAINDEKTLLSRLSNNKDALYIVFITFDYQVENLFRMLAETGVTTAFFARVMIPFPSVERSLWLKLKQKIGLIVDRKYVVGRVKNYFVEKRKFKGKLKTHDIVFMAGTDGIHTVGIGAAREAKYASKIQINALDYDQYLSLRNNTERIFPTPYCVFLDNYLPHHPDFDILGIKKIAAENYYKGLNRLFDKIEREQGVKIIIAAHPKSDYTINPFNGRPVFVRKTAEAVKDAAFVIAHASTSVAFAVLFGKKIIFAYNDQMRSLYKYSMFPLLESFNSALNGQLINIDRIDDCILEIGEPSEAHYSAYKYKYLTSPETENICTKDIIFSLLGINDAS